MHIMERKVLTYGEFSACKLIAQTHHTDEEALSAIAKWDYEKYCLSRYVMSKCKGYNMVICTEDPSHEVTVTMTRCVVEENPKTGELNVTEQEGDTTYYCDTCESKGGGVVINDYDLFEEFETLHKQPTEVK